MSNLQKNAAPPNPSTPNVRVNARGEYLEGLARVRKSLETLIEKTDESQPIEQQIFAAMHYAVMKLLSGVDGQAVSAGMAQSLGAPTMPGALGSPQQAPQQAPGPPPPNPALQAALSGAAPGAAPVASLGA